MEFSAPLLYAIWLDETSALFESINANYPINEDFTLDCIKLITEALKRVSMRTIMDTRVQRVDDVIF